MRYHLKNWNWKTWLACNKSNLRLIIAGVAGLLTTYLSGLQVAWAVPLGGIVTALVKLLLDTLDYFVSDN